mmetsp:Transcript_24583/g.78506  ORF Transcript_24583/g.78506 Transcript_24583/m.78506 type:complete len:469 (+) Transcript_24583:102-1508(+)
MKENKSPLEPSGTMHRANEHIVSLSRSLSLSLSRPRRAQGCRVGSSCIPLRNRFVYAAVVKEQVRSAGHEDRLGHTPSKRGVEHGHFTFHSMDLELILVDHRAVCKLLQHVRFAQICIACGLSEERPAAFIRRALGNLWLDNVKVEHARPFGGGRLGVEKIHEPFTCIRLVPRYWKLVKVQIDNPARVERPHTIETVDAREPLALALDVRQDRGGVHLVHVLKRVSDVDNDQAPVVNQRLQHLSVREKREPSLVYNCMRKAREQVVLDEQAKCQTVDRARHDAGTHHRRALLRHRLSRQRLDCELDLDVSILDGFGDAQTQVPGALVHHGSVEVARDEHGANLQLGDESAADKPIRDRVLEVQTAAIEAKIFLCCEGYLGSPHGERSLAAHEAARDAWIFAHLVLVPSAVHRKVPVDKHCRHDRILQSMPMRQRAGPDVIFERFRNVSGQWLRQDGAPPIVGTRLVQN